MQNVFLKERKLYTKYYFNGMLTCLGLFCAQRLGNFIHFYIFYVVISQEFFFSLGSAGYKLFLNRSICSIDEILTGTTTWHLRSTGSNDKVFRNRASPSSGVKCHAQDTPFLRGSYPSADNTVNG